MPKLVRVLKSLARLFAVFAAVAVVIGLIGAGVGYVLYGRYVVDEPGTHLGRQHIRSIIAQESPVYYRDGTTRVGVFFEDEHRQFVEWDDLPRAYVMAIVAAEDGDYWSHRGLNFRGIARAMRDNVRAGRLVAGGSTLTQQTAKNLYYRPDRSFKSKWAELVNTLRLEAHYSKTEVLTFYVNQFHVSGNGRGLGIAARHFFDKNVSELSVLESAFLAGLVKAPSYYDPFIGGKERRARSLKRAHDRTTYVLRRMTSEPIENLAGPRPEDSSVVSYSERLARAQGVRAEARALLDDGFELDFKRGVFRYDSSAMLDEIRRRLGEAPFDQVLAQAGISDPSTAGLKVITTLDPALQRSATYGLWHHLTELGLWLEPKEAKDFIREGGRSPRFDPDRAVIQEEFRLARVSDLLGEPKAHFRVDLGGPTCLVDRAAIVRVAVASYRGQQKNRYVKAPGSFVDSFAKSFSVDDVVWVSVRDSEQGLCDLELRPELQGSTVVLQNGEIRALVGGNDNRNFNRASALRQMGSVWKILIFHAAMELGWTPDEVLDNSRNVFPFSTTYYFPRPDHEPEERVSMAWAGVKSENLASIWLLYHLVDRLDGEELGRLAGELGLARGAEEAEEDYRLRIQKVGILPTPRRVSEALFLQARQEVLAGEHVENRPAEKVALKSLLYGWGYRTESKRVDAGPANERGWKQEALDNSWVRLAPLLGICRQQYFSLQKGIESRDFPAPEAIGKLSVWIDGKNLRVACGGIPQGYVRAEPSLLKEFGGTRVKSAETAWALADLLAGGSSPAPEPASVEDLLELVEVGEVLVNQRLRLDTLTAVGDAMRRRELARELAGTSGSELYEPELLYWHQDFRVLLAMRYVTALARKYGVQTPINEVLSMPLGASEATIEEMTFLYGGLVTGQRWTFPGETSVSGFFSDVDTPPPDASTLLIAEILDVDGRVIYRANPTAEPVASEETAEMTSDILLNVVRWGTGKRAAQGLVEGEAFVPLGGKTGTTNDYKNAAFLGFAPGWSERGGFVVADGLIVGSYIGYDDNRPMTSGQVRIAGASGALPAWLGALDGAHDVGALGESQGELTDGRWPILHSHRVRRVPVDERGLLVEGEIPSDSRSVLVPMPDWSVALDVNFDLTDLEAVYREALTVEEGLERRAEEGAYSTVWGELPVEPTNAVP